MLLLCITLRVWQLRYFLSLEQEGNQIQAWFPLASELVTAGANPAATTQSVLTKHAH